MSQAAPLEKVIDFKKVKALQGSKHFWFHRSFLKEMKIQTIFSTTFYVEDMTLMSKPNF